MSTISDVAERAGVSKTTVSRFLNGQYDQMAESTRERIMAAVQELGYRPNRLAASLKTKRTYTLGAVVSNITNPFFAQVVQTIEDTAARSGYNLILSSTGDDPDKEARYVNVLRDRQVDGLVVATSGTALSLYKELYDRRFPVVLIDRRIPDVPYDYVALDNAEGVRQAVQYLSQLGHRRVALVTGRPIELASRRERADAFQRYVREFGMEWDPGLVIVESPTEAGGRLAAGRALELSPRPTALISSINVMTLGAIKALRDRGIDVPGEMSVIGFDDVEWMAATTPPITAVAQPVQELGAQAVSRLIWMIEEGEASRGQGIRLAPELIVRASCDRPRA